MIDVPSQLRLDVLPVTTPLGDGFQVRALVNGTALTELGMDPYAILVPTNRLAAAGVVPIGRCICGDYGCSPTDVTITRADSLVHWDLPSDRHSFTAASYDREVARVFADHSWETPDRAAGRLVLTNCSQPIDWVSNHRDPALFRVALRFDEYQVFVDTPWRGRSPEQLAQEIVAKLALPPSEWTATWQSTRPTTLTPPAIAGKHWKREPY